MPVMDGLTSVKKIRELQEEKIVARVPVIAISATQGVSRLLRRRTVDGWCGYEAA